MPESLAEITAKLVAELHAAFDQNDPSPRLDDALCSYVAYWRRMGASSTSIVEFTQRLIDRSRDPKTPLDTDSARESDAIVAELLARCFTLASEPRR